MFPRHKRLTREAFPQALTRGRRISSTHFSAVLPKTGQGYAVVVSKKVARLSVTRHRIKRVVVAALRGLVLPPSIILFPKASTSNLSALDLRTELKALLSKIA